MRKKRNVRNKAKTILTPEGGDVCDSGDHESNGKDKEELVQQQQQENCEAESRDNSTGDIYSDSDDEDKRKVKDKEELIEENRSVRNKAKTFRLLKVEMYVILGTMKAMVRTRKNWFNNNNNNKRTVRLKAKTTLLE